MIRTPPRSTLTNTLVPSTTLFLSQHIDQAGQQPRDQGMGRSRQGHGRAPAILRRQDDGRSQMLRCGGHEYDLTFGKSRQDVRWRKNSIRSEEHTSELQSLMRISYAVFCLKKKKQITLKN